MTQNAFPSVNPADLDSLTGLFREVFKKLMQNIDGALPAKVIAFNRTIFPNRVQVQAAISVLTTRNELVPRAQIVDLPVLQLGGGGFIFSVNLKPGDDGWIFAADRDISLYLQTLKISAPNTLRIKKFSDAIFIPASLGAYTLADEDVDNAVLQSLDGTVKISLSTNKIKIAAPTVEIDTTTATINATTANIESEQVNVTATTNIIATTPLFAVSGNITAGGTITPGTPPP
jgi:hypothetical protein